jgi:hypothetical protein
LSLRANADSRLLYVKTSELYRGDPGQEKPTGIVKPIRVTVPQTLEELIGIAIARLEFHDE